MWVVAAFGATPVVAEGGVAAEEVARVAARTGLPLEQLDAQPFEVLASRAVVGVVGEGALRRCPGATNPASVVDADLARAEAASSAGDAVAAWTQLDRVVVELSCLSEVVSVPVAAKVFTVRAAVRRARGDAAGASEEESTAAAFSGPPAAGGVVVRSVGGGSSGPWLDGRVVSPAGVQVAPGPHLFQYAEAGVIRSGWLTVGGPLAVVFPAGLHRPLLDGLSDPARREVAELWLRAMVDVPAVYVTSGGGMWLVELVEPVRTTELVPPVASGTPAPSTKRGKRP